MIELMEVFRIFCLLIVFWISASSFLTVFTFIVWWPMWQHNGYDREPDVCVPADLIFPGLSEYKGDD